MEMRSERASTGFVSAGALLVGVLTGPAAGQVTSRLSVDSSGAQANVRSGYYGPSISTDGRFVAFESRASNLVGGDTNVSEDVFVHDCQSGATERVSMSSAGVEGNNSSGHYGVSISADGRWVAFGSSASNLVSGDTNGVSDTFVHDRQSGTTEHVSVNSSGAQGSGGFLTFGSLRPSISADGRYVAFDSDATNLVAGDTNDSTDVFVRDRQMGTTERVSIDSIGAEGIGFSESPSISADGRYVAFHSIASTLVSGDSNGTGDVFVRDRQSSTTELVSVDSGEAQADSGSLEASISVSGRYVAFTSWASNLVVGDTNTIPDVFVRDRQDGTTERVSVDSAGAQGNGWSEVPSISADGRCVAFKSLATNLVAGDTNGCDDVLLRAEPGTKYCTANPNSTGSPADLEASGSPSSGAGDLLLTSMPVPNQNGIFFHGANVVQIPFGNGFLCTNGGIARGAIVMGVGNVATYFYDNSDAMHSLAAFIGSTRNFQHWFRDPAAGGAFFNTSNAMAIAIAP